MYDLTLKDKDNNNVLFKAVQAATANSPAVWNHEADTPILSEVISFSARDNGPKTARRLRITLQAPGVNALCVDSCEVHVIPVSIEMTVPKVLDRDRVADVVAYLAALLADSNLQDSIKSGFAPA